MVAMALLYIWPLGGLFILYWVPDIAISPAQRLYLCCGLIALFSLELFNGIDVRINEKWGLQLVL